MCGFRETFTDLTKQENVCQRERERKKKILISIW